MLTAVWSTGPSHRLVGRPSSRPGTRTAGRGCAGLVELHVSDQRLGAVGSDHPVQQHGRVRRLGAHRAAGVEQRPESREPPDPSASRSRSASVASVRSHSMPKAPNSAVAARKSRLKVRTGDMRGRRRDVRAQVLRRDQLGRPALDLLAGQGVGHVRGPDPLHALEHAEVDPAATGGARLPGHPRVTGAERVEQRVEGKGLGVHRRRAVALAAPASSRSRLWSHFT